jgi:hypothetical protein
MTPREMELLSAYHDGETDPQETVQIERLLSDDPSARLVLDELRRTTRLVSNLPRHSAPDDFRERFAARVEREALLGSSTRGGSLIPSVLRWSSIAAAIGLVVIGWRIYQPPLEVSTRAPAGFVKDDDQFATANAPPVMERSEKHVTSLDTARGVGGAAPQARKSVAHRELGAEADMKLAMAAPASAPAVQPVEMVFRLDDREKVRTRIDQFIARTGAARIAEGESDETNIVLPGLDWIVPGLSTSTQIPAGTDLIVHVDSPQLQNFVASVSDLTLPRSQKEESENLVGNVAPPPAPAAVAGDKKMSTTPAASSHDVRVRIRFRVPESNATETTASQPTSGVSQ